MLIPLLLDTQIISYAYNGKTDYSVENMQISAVTAMEFLEVHNEDPRNPNYVIPIISRYHFLTSAVRAELLKRKHGFNLTLSDKMILNFGAKIPSLYYFGLLALTLVINEKNYELFNDSICLIEKEKRKKLRKKFAFLLSNNITSIPISKSVVQLSFELLTEFIKIHNVKNNFRNSFNDILILSTSLDLQIPLETEDSLLNRFAVELFKLTSKVENNILTIYPAEKLNNGMQKFESKGYINNGWKVSFSKYRNYL